MNWFRTLFLTSLLAVAGLAAPASATALLFFEEGPADGSFDYFAPQSLTVPPPGGWAGIIGSVDLSNTESPDN
jgi:O-antigen/teichoic acid export membrane protein